MADVMNALIDYLTVLLEYIDLFNYKVAMIYKMWKVFHCHSV